MPPRKQSCHDAVFQEAQPCFVYIFRCHSGSLSVWASLDLRGRHTRSIRDFNPNEVTRLDTAMWRSCYAKQRLLLFFELTELPRKEYHLGWLHSRWVAAQAAKGAFVFKEDR